MLKIALAGDPEPTSVCRSSLCLRRFQLRA